MKNQTFLLIFRCHLLLCTIIMSYQAVIAMDHTFIDQAFVPRLTTLCYRYLPEALQIKAENVAWANETIPPWLDLSDELQILLLTSAKVINHTYAIQGLIYRDYSAPPCGAIHTPRMNKKWINFFNLSGNGENNFKLSFDNCKAVSLNPTKDIIAELSPEGEIGLWYDGILTKEFEHVGNLLSGTAPIAWSEDGERIAFRSPNGLDVRVVYVLDANKRGLIDELSISHNNPSKIKTIQWSKWGKKILMVRKDQSVDLLDTTNDKVLNCYDAVDDCMALSPDEFLFAYVKKGNNEGNNVWYLDLFKEGLLATTLCLGQQPTAIRWSPVARTLAVLVMGKLLLLSFDDEGKLTQKEKSPNSFDAISKFLWSPAGNCIACLTENNSAALCYINDRMSLVSFNLPGLQEMVWHPQGDYVCLASDTTSYFIEAIKQSWLTEAESLTFAQAALLCNIARKKLSAEVKSIYKILFNMTSWPEALRNLIDKKMQLNDEKIENS